LYPPSRGVCFSNPKYLITFPFHLWDWIAATRTFNNSWTPFCDNSRYKPSVGDIRFGDFLQSQWKAMIYNGTLIRSGIQWSPMTPNIYNVGEIHSSYIDNRLYEYFRNGVWNVLEKPPLMLNTEPFWLVN